MMTRKVISTLFRDKFRKNFETKNRTLFWYFQVKKHMNILAWNIFLPKFLITKNQKRKK